MVGFIQPLLFIQPTFTITSILDMTANIVNVMTADAVHSCWYDDIPKVQWSAPKRPRRLSSSSALLLADRFFQL